MTRVTVLFIQMKRTLMARDTRAIAPGRPICYSLT
jgi:hypothetical protein